MTDRKTRVRATREALARAMEICPDAEFVVVSAGSDSTPNKIDLTAATNASPSRTIELLDYASEDFRIRRVRKVLP
jgi:uncharacterized protein